MFDAYGAAAVASSAALWGSSLVGATLSLISTTRDKRPAPRRRPTSDPPFADIESHADRIPSSEEYGHAGFFGALHRVWSVILHVVLMLFAAIALADVMSSLRDEARSAAIPDAGPESVHRYDLATGYCGAYRLLGEQSSNTGLFTADNFDGCSTLQRIVLSAFDPTHHVSYRQHTHRMIQRETDSLPLFSVRMVLQKDLPSRVETPVTDMMALAPVRQEQPQAEVPDINPPAEVPNTLPPVVEQTTQAATEAPTGTESEPAAGSANENDDNGGTSSNGDAASNGSGSSRQDSGPRFLKPTRDECAPALERSLIILMLEMIIEIVLVIAGAILMSAKEIRRQFRRWKVILLLLYLVPVLFFNVGIFWFGGAPTGSCKYPSVVLQDRTIPTQTPQRRVYLSNQESRTDERIDTSHPLTFGNILQVLHTFQRQGWFSQL